MPFGNNTSNTDATFVPDAPHKVEFYQVIILFIYHIVLGLGLAYAIYNVWPPQPWPGDKLRPVANANGNSQPATNANTVNGNTAAGSTASRTRPTPGANASAATGVGENVGSGREANGNSNGLNGNANTAGNANTELPVNTNSVTGPNANAAPPPNPKSDVGTTESSSASAAGDELPPPIYLFGKKFQPPLEVRLILLVFLVGAAGSYIHATSSLVDYLGNRTFISSWVWWYLLRPFIGMMLALLFYFVFRGGFITAGVNPAGDAATSFINPFGVAALAGLVGMFSKVASDKLNEVFTTLFRPAQGQGDAKRGDKLNNPTSQTVTSITPASGPAAGGTSVKILGTGFLPGAKVNFGGIPAVTVNVNSSTSITATTPPHAPATVDVDIINNNDQKGTLKNGFIYN